MRACKLLLIILSICFIFNAPFAYPQSNIKKIMREASPAILTVFALDENNRPIGQGSGFIIESDGLIVSNFHVIERAPWKSVFPETGTISFHFALLW